MKIIIIVFVFITFALNVFSQQNIKILVAGKSFGNLTVNEIKEAKKVTLNTDTIKIISFNFSGIVTGYTKDVGVQGDSFTDACYDLLSKITVKKIYIENVTGITKSGKEILIGSMKYNIIK